MAETTRNHIFSKEISQVIIAAIVLAPNFYWKNCLRVISAMRGNPPLLWRSKGLRYSLDYVIQPLGKSVSTEIIHAPRESG